MLSFKCCIKQHIIQITEKCNCVPLFLPSPHFLLQPWRRATHVEGSGQSLYLKKFLKDCNKTEHSSPEPERRFRFLQNSAFLVSKLQDSIKKTILQSKEPFRYQDVFRIQFGFPSSCFQALKICIIYKNFP